MIPVAPINGREEAVQPLELRAQWNVPLTILAVLGVLGAMRMAQGVLMPIVVSVLIAYALDRVVCFLERLGLGRAIASGVLLIIIVAAVGATGYGLRTEAMAVLDGFPEASRRFREVIAANTGKPGPIEKVKTAATEIGKAAEAATGGTPPSSSIPRVQLAEPVSQTSAYLWIGFDERGGVGRPGGYDLFPGFFSVSIRRRL